MSSLIRYNYKKVSKNSISSIENLAVALGLSVEEIERAVNLPSESKYTKKFQPKLDGGERKAYNPHRYIRQVQRKVNERILSAPSIIEWPDFVFGSIPNTKKGEEEEVHKDYVSCAKRHCEAKCLMRVDVKDFFDNIHRDTVFDIFHNFLNYPENVSEILTDICTYQDFLPQGALTSGYLACLCLYDLEPSVVKRLERKGLVYTRYVDDIAVSSKVHDYDFSFAKKVIDKMLLSKDLPVNEDKTHVFRLSSEPLVLHGLRISFKEPRLPAKEVSNIRAAVQSAEKLARVPGYRTTRVYRKYFNQCMGRVNKLGRVGHNKHSSLVKRLKAIHPLANEDDVRRAKSMISKLEHDHPKKCHTYSYHKRFHRAHQRINIIRNNFPNAAIILRERLNAVPSSYRH